jgi:hypothetical protein
VEDVGEQHVNGVWLPGSSLEVDSPEWNWLDIVADALPEGDRSSDDYASVRGVWVYAETLGRTG